MTAIFRREINAYFSSPVGYIYLFLYYILSGFFFFVYCLFGNSASLAGVFTNMFTIILFVIPILTMRLLSEDKKNKTDQALLTAPVSLTGLVLGKFFAALAVYALGLAITLVYALIIAAYTPPDWSIILSNLLAFLMLGAALIAIGMFISSLTEHQVIAAVGGIAVGLGLLFVDNFGAMAGNAVLAKFLSAISFYNRYSVFITGIFNFSSILFFASICFLFCFFTVRVLEKRRWS